VIGDTYRDDPRKDRRRRRLLFLLLLLLPVSFALGGLSGAWLTRSPNVPAPATSLAGSQAPTRTPGATGTETVQGVEVVASPTPFSGGGDATAQAGGSGFSITGGASHLAPGRVVPIRLTLTNPNGAPIQVTSLVMTISADSTPGGCSSAANIRLTQSNASAANPITVPGGGSVTLETGPRAPQIELLNLPDVNQDVCKGKTFTLTYSGSAHS
jgi:hypothetical protein